MASVMTLVATAIAAVLVPAAAIQHASGPDNSATAEAIAALDTDHSGKVERNEVEAFARAQGLNEEDVKGEFAALDSNGDGLLSEDEISRTLAQRTGAPSTIAASPPSAASPPTTIADVTQDERPVAVAAEPAAAAVAILRGEEHLVNEAVQTDATQHAGKALAEVFARTAAKVLESRSQDAGKAEKLEQAAKQLREQTAMMKRTAAEQTVHAAAEAAQAVLKESTDKVRELETQADLIEQQAREKRKVAKEAMVKALRAQSELKQNIKTQEA